MSTNAPSHRAALNHGRDDPGSRPRSEAHINASPLKPISSTARPRSTTSRINKNMDHTRMSQGLPFCSSNALSLKPESTACTLLEA